MREARLERQQACGAGHRRVDGGDARVALGRDEQRFGERLGVARGCTGRALRSDDGVEDGDVVETLLLVIFGERVSASLLCQDVDDDGPVVVGSLVQRVLEGADVVAVDRPHVADAERFEEVAGLEHLAQRGA